LLLRGSSKTQQQVLQGKGFLVIGTLLEKAKKDHLNSKRGIPAGVFYSVLMSGLAW